MNCRGKLINFPSAFYKVGKEWVNRLVIFALWNERSICGRMFLKQLYKQGGGWSLPSYGGDTDVNLRNDEFTFSSCIHIHGIFCSCNYIGDFLCKKKRPSPPVRCDGHFMTSTGPTATSCGITVASRVLHALGLLRLRNSPLIIPSDF
jgi:hypothetical protein